MSLDILTPDDVAELLKVPRRTVVHLCAGGRLPAVKLGSHWRIARPAIHRALPWVTLVYFAEAVGLSAVKIGYSSDVLQRVQDIQVHCPVEVSVIGVIPGTRETEAAVHRRFAAAHIRGEWFRLWPEILEFCDENRKALGL